MVFLWDSKIADWLTLHNRKTLWAHPYMEYSTSSSFKENQEWDNSLKVKAIQFLSYNSIATDSQIFHLFLFYSWRWIYFAIGFFVCVHKCILRLLVFRIVTSPCYSYIIETNNNLYSKWLYCKLNASVLWVRCPLWNYNISEQIATFRLCNLIKIVLFNMD